MKRLRACAILLLLMLPLPVYADNCGSLSDCYGNTLAAVAVALAIAAVVALLILLLPEAAGAAAVAEAVEGTEITAEGLATVTEHLAQFGEDAANEMMIQRLQAALEAGEELTGADANFYLHELYESELMTQGMNAEEAHQAALEFYSHSPYSLYHSEVVQALYPEYFNLNWLRYWGLIP
jgi:filamentous hemagglutinin